MLDQWKKRQKRAWSIYNNNLFTMGEERYVVRSIDLLGCASRDREERCGATINKQLMKADAEQTTRNNNNNNNNLLQSYLCGHNYKICTSITTTPSFSMVER